MPVAQWQSGWFTSSGSGVRVPPGILCDRGGAGIRLGLRCQGPKGCTGSSPVDRTLREWRKGNRAGFRYQ